MRRTRFPERQVREKAGRKTLFKQEMLQEVFNYCVLGANDQQVASLLGININTVNLWKRSRPAFRRAMELGKTQADAKVVESLFHRAMGYEHEETLFFNIRGELVERKVIKHYPPDTTACIFWLKNRQREQWTDVNQVNIKHSGSIQHVKVEELPLNLLSKEEQQLLLQINNKQLSKNVTDN